MKQDIRTIVYAVVLAAAFLLPLPAPAQSTQETLNQYIADLQKNPDDNALREKIIKLAQEMKPALVVPEDAERYMVRGGAAVKDAKNEKDFADAAVEFEKASLAAPWVAAPYYNLGITQDKAGKYAEAIQNLKFYLLAVPDSKDAKEVKNLIYEIEYRQEKATKGPALEAAAAKKEDEPNAWLKKLDGARYVNKSPDGLIEIIDIKGTKLMDGAIYSQNYPGITAGKFYENSELSSEITGREFDIRPQGGSANDALGIAKWTYVINEDGSKITRNLHRKNGTISAYEFYREK